MSLSLLVSIIVAAAIIVLQIFFFKKNVLRMREYKEIFAEKNSWGVLCDDETRFVLGISGQGNAVFESIKTSINKYLQNNAGSVIEFSLLKDTVDRHSDAVEDDINTLTPIPLYCGLAGTMAGVIIGLSSLLTSKFLENFEMGGVKDLLYGVACAMVASICGILLTTIASLLFKRCKLVEESGKNTFLAWLQSRLLPALPNDMSQAFNNLVRDLNEFNEIFADNTTHLGDALNKVNESYRIQAEVIKTVHDIDVMKMATVNVSVLKELKGCTDKLKIFNQYLSSVQGYTEAINNFTTLFNQASDRLSLLEEIQQYLTRHKAEIAKDSADVDVALRNALQALKDTASSNTNELHSVLVKQAEEFKEIIRDEKESFEEVSREMQAQFTTQLNQIPMFGKRLEEISAIPSKLDELIKRIEQSNRTLALELNSSMKRTAQDLVSSPKGGTAPAASLQMLPKWMKWTITVSVISIALTCIYSAYNTRQHTQYDSRASSTQDVAGDIDYNVEVAAVDSVAADTVQPFPNNQ